MFGNFAFFESPKKAVPEKTERLKGKLALTFDSRQDFSEAKQMAEEITDEIKKQELLDEIQAIEGGAAPKFTELVTNEKPPDEGIDIQDVKEAIAAGDFEDAKYFAHEMAGEEGKSKNPKGEVFTSTDEFWGAKALLLVAKAEFEKGEDPKKTIAEAKEMAWYIDGDLPRQVSIFADIVKLESDFGLIDDARKTLAELKERANRPDWREHNADTLAIIAQIEKDIGLSDDEIEKLDDATVNSLLEIHPELSADVKNLRPDMHIPGSE